MKEVNKEEFYSKIRKLDACVRSEVNEYGHYTCTFTLRYGHILGKSVDTDHFTTKYYLVN